MRAAPAQATWLAERAERAGVRSRRAAASSAPGRLDRAASTRGAHVPRQNDLVATAAYQPQAESAAAARHFVQDTLRSWQRSGDCRGRDDLVDDAVLLTSELVTNAVVHAGTPVEVTCRLADEGLEIVVVDHQPERISGPSRQPASAERTSGRGLQLPDELASSWGITYAGTSKAVWFRLGLSGPPGP